MPFVYILQSEKNGKYYVGSSEDPSRRLLEHNSGRTKSLRNILPMKILYKQEFADTITARKVEYKIKKAKSRNIIEQIVKDQEIKMGL